MEIDHWIQGIQIQTLRVYELVEKIDEDQLNWSPAKGKWSVGQLLDHLMTTNESYFQIFDSIAKGRHKNPSLLGARVIPKALGKMVIKSVTPETVKKTRTVAAFQPMTDVHAKSILDDFESSQDALIKKVKRIGELQLETIWIKSPASGLIIYTVDEALKMILNHEKRHLGQAEKIVSKLKYEEGKLA